MAGFDAPVIEYGGDDLGSQVDRRKLPSEYEQERKTLLDFIRNFRKGHEAYYRYGSVVFYFFSTSISS